MDSNSIANSGEGWGEVWPAPAKINLMLRIVGRRDDGYHLLQTVFQLVDLCDGLIFRSLDEDCVKLANPLPAVAAEDDLTVRAAKLLKQETGCGKGVSIEMQKKLPMGGGLGGGSSDAATTLVVLNHLWELGLSQQKLLELGLQLGADVPFFIFGKSAWAEGVGEELVEIDVPEKWVLVVKPDDHVNTGLIFNNKNLTRNSKPITIADFLAGSCSNDCLSVVRELYQSVDDALCELSNYAEPRLTGTGACVFALFDSYEEAFSVYSRFRSDWQVYLAKSVSKSPLLQKLSSKAVL